MALCAEEGLVFCKGCGENKKLIKAHIIPKSFYMDLRANANHLNIVPSNVGERQSRSNIGDYDTNILCKDCDTIMEKYDDYGKKLLLDQRDSFIEHERNGQLLGWEVHNFDYLKLKLFFLSILWRASISSRPFFRRVSLAQYEDKLKELIWNEQDDDNHTFGCVVAKFLPANIEGVEKSILDPDKTTLEGRNYYRFYFGGYNIWIRVDERGVPAQFKHAEIKNGGSLKVVPRDFQESKEFKMLEKSVKSR
ncbi:hypothetical protein [Thalassotalea atypica]|uniref:hypothetical protein n=1 Tax=Thalassotalea atypica TaxID=2054316 RepID=UPI0025724A0E|nr:hypothetical protein [Thalassotalea atypica]